jgi:hypothetical protein
VKGGTVARDYFSYGTDFYVDYGDDVAQFFVDDSFIFCFDLLMPDRFERVAECFRWNSNCVF